MLRVVADEEKDKRGRQRDQWKHGSVVLPLITVTIKEIIAMTDPVLHTSDITQNK